MRNILSNILPKTNRDQRVLLTVLIIQSTFSDGRCSRFTITSPILINRRSVLSTVRRATVRRTGARWLLYGRAWSRQTAPYSQRHRSTTWPPVAWPTYIIRCPIDRLGSHRNGDQIRLLSTDSRTTGRSIHWKETVTSYDELSYCMDKRRMFTLIIHEMERVLLVLQDAYCEVVPCSSRRNGFAAKIRTKRYAKLQCQRKRFTSMRPNGKSDIILATLQRPCFASKLYYFRLSVMWPRSRSSAELQAGQLPDGVRRAVRRHDDTA